METGDFVELNVKNINNNKMETIKLPAKYAGVNIEDYSSQPDYCPDTQSVETVSSDEFYETQENASRQNKLNEDIPELTKIPNHEKIQEQEEDYGDMPELIEISNDEEKQEEEDYGDMPELVEISDDEEKQEEEDFGDMPELMEIPDHAEKQEQEDMPELMEIPDHAEKQEQEDYKDMPELLEKKNEQFKEITTEEAYAFRAIEMWYNVVYRCRLLATGNHGDNYRDYISNVLAQKDVKTITEQIRKVIADFHDYFYTKKHIAHLNYRKYEKLTDDYAQFKTIISAIKSGYDKGVCSREGKELVNILIEVSLYAFEKIIPFRKEWGLFVFEEEKQDEYLVKYYSDYDERKQEN